VKSGTAAADVAIKSGKILRGTGACLPACALEPYWVSWGAAEQARPGQGGGRQ
jgi:hypothetical protein